VAYDGLRFEVETETHAAEDERMVEFRGLLAAEWAAVFGNEEKLNTESTEKEPRAHRENRTPRERDCDGNLMGFIGAPEDAAALHWVGKGERGGGDCLHVCDRLPKEWCCCRSRRRRDSTTKQRMEWFAALGMRSGGGLPVNEALSRLRGGGCRRDPGAAVASAGRWWVEIIFDSGKRKRVM